MLHYRISASTPREDIGGTADDVVVVALDVVVSTESLREGVNTLATTLDRLVQSHPVTVREEMPF